MSQMTATRSELLARRAQVAPAVQGRELLKEKRSALLRESNRLGMSVLAALAALERGATDADRLLGAAVTDHGVEQVHLAAAVAQHEVPLTLAARSVAGVSIVEITKAAVARPPTGRGYGLAGTSARIDATAASFEAVLDGLLEVAALELSLRTLANEISRMNAPEHVIVQLPVFSGFGLPGLELAATIAENARVRGRDSGFVVVFAAIGVTDREAAFLRRRFSEGAAFERTVLFLNLAAEPTVERLTCPRAALTAAAYLAFDLGLDVLVVLVDMTNYCEALREVAAAREEIPGRRGYLGCMYTDLASLYELAGRIRGRAGSVTQLPVLSMPDDDVTHPIPDLTGHITEGQIVLLRELDRRGINPPIDVLPSLRPLMNAGIGNGKTREDHRGVADQLYAVLARGRELRRLVSVVGEQALSEDARRTLAFAEEFERRFVGQGAQRRSIEQTLYLAWELLSRFLVSELKRIKPDLVQRCAGMGVGP